MNANPYLLAGFGTVQKTRDLFSKLGQADLKNSILNGRWWYNLTAMLSIGLSKDCTSSRRSARILKCPANKKSSSLNYHIHGFHLLLI